MFEQLKQRMRDVLDRASTPGDPRAMVSLMREAVVEAKMAVREMREQLEATRRRLKIERDELDTVRRRGRLAAQIEDAQTMQVAADYERRHGERVSVLERKLAAQEAELMLAEREVEEMTRELKARAAGITGSGAAAEVGEGSPFPPDDPLDDDAGLRGDIDRAARETRAAEMLAELKRRMGK
jgi:hypothetical protein